MKLAYPQYSLSGFCRLFGISRQAFYQHFRVLESAHFQKEILIQQIRCIRQDHPRLGGRKLLLLLQPFLKKHHINIGRDSLFNLLADHKMLVKRRTRQTQTTFSKHWMRKWPNLIKNYEVDTINALWVSDITYWKVNSTNYYISLITDVRSRKIIGYSIDLSLKLASTLDALQMALCYRNQVAKNLIHHSDRGSQYCATEYVSLLHEHNIKISMTESSEPTDNAIAERVNGILKDEYLQQYLPASLKSAKAVLAVSVHNYNQLRPHLSIENNTPNRVFKSKSRKFTRLWKASYKKQNVNQFQD